MAEANPLGGEESASYLRTDRRRTGIVTGASSGIGRATAVLLARDGYDVGLTYMANRDGAEAVAEQIRDQGGRVAVRYLNLGEPQTVDGTLTELIDELGGLDLLVNNAGVNRRCSMVEETIDGLNHTLAVNLVGAWACARVAARHMMERGGGRIVNVTSVLAYTPLAGAGAYCAAKAALESITKVMALEWAPNNISVNSVAPGHTATPINYPTPGLAEEALRHRPVIPIGRAASPEEVARAILFLAGADASYMIGASLVVDGGLLLASAPSQLEHAIGLPPARPTS